MAVVVVSKDENFSQDAIIDPAARAVLAPKIAAVMPTQATRLQLSVYGRIGYVEGKMTLYITLENSEISPGQMLFDTDSSRGRFQDKIEVSIHLDSTDDLRLHSIGPQNVNGSVSTGSSVSVSSSDSENAGFFGATLSGGVTHGNSSSVSSHFDRNLADFSIIESSDTTTARHSYNLSLVYGHGTDAGGPYEGPWSLINGNLRFYDLPQLAKGNLPIISQAVWKADAVGPITSQATVTITVRQRLVWVDLRGDGAALITDQWVASGLVHDTGQRKDWDRKYARFVEYTYSVPIDFSLALESDSAASPQQPSGPGGASGT